MKLVLVVDRTLTAFGRVGFVEDKKDRTLHIDFGNGEASSVYQSSLVDMDVIKTTDFENLTANVQLALFYAVYHRNLQCILSTPHKPSRWVVKDPSQGSSMGFLKDRRYQIILDDPKQKEIKEIRAEMEVLAKRLKAVEG